MTLQIGLRADAQDHDWHNLVTGLTLIVLNRGDDLPDDAVAITADMDSEATLPLGLQRISEVRGLLQLIEQAPTALDLPMGLRVVLL